MPDTFNAFRIHADENDYRAGIEELGLDDLSEGGLAVEAAWSSVNFKDALAGRGKAPILRESPLVGGIDAAGIVLESASDRFAPGDRVLVTGCGLSETRDGGYAEKLKLEADWAVPLPDGLTLREAMALGTAGFTAALALWRMEANGQSPDQGALVVTGASGGVGMLALDVYTRAGYEVHAISGKEDEFPLLQELGARQCVSRHGLDLGSRPLESARWAGALDNVGGRMLDGLTRVIQPWGNIASCGNAGGIELHTTVMPFIIRGVSLLGINSAGCPYDIRRELWRRLAQEWKPKHLDEIARREVGLDELPAVFDRMLEGQSTGRTLVRLSGRE